MKKILPLIGVTLLTLTLAACGGSGSSNSGSTTGSTTTASAFTCAGLSAAFASGSTTPTNLSCVDSPAGTGAVLTAGETPNLTFTGYLYNSANAGTDYEGTIFQPTYTGSSSPIGVGAFITGFDQGLLGMQVGGTRILLIPAALAYGASPPTGSGIPANAALIFVVTLNSIAS
jgi:FKBP-type peptidyl-prolyl cis-trans isomerase